VVPARRFRKLAAAVILRAIEDKPTHWFMSSCSRQAFEGDAAIYCLVMSAFVATRSGAPSVVAPIIDDIAMNESLNNGSAVHF